MRMRKILTGAALILTLSSVAGVAFAHHRAGVKPPPELFNMLLSGICADQQHLYVMAGGKIMQYGLSDMTLLKTVALPDPPAPPSPPSSEADLKKLPPPPMAMPHGLWVGDSFLYVLAGPVVYRYSTLDMSLQTTVELPQPELPETGN